MDNATSRVKLLVWDESDMQQRLAEVIGKEPELAQRPAMDAVFFWLMDRCGAGDEPEATFFTGVLGGTEEITAPWVTELRQSGFGVFVKPLRSRDDRAEFGNDILAQIDRAAGDGSLTEVIVASHDAGRFESRLVSLASQGVKATVLGFRERAGFAAQHDNIEFVDLETVPDAITVELPRTNLYDLPIHGRVLKPLGRPQRGRRSARTANPAAAALVQEATPGAPARTASSEPARSASATGAAVTRQDEAAPLESPAADLLSASASPPPPPPATPTAVEAAPTPTPTPTPVAGDTKAPVAPAVDNRATAGFRPTREAVSDHVVELVSIAGDDGLTVNQLGFELRRRYPAFDESSIGFSNMGDLAEQLAGERQLTLERDPNGAPLLRTGSSVAASSSTLDDLLSGIRPPSRSRGNGSSN